MSSIIRTGVAVSTNALAEARRALSIGVERVKKLEISEELKTARQVAVGVGICYVVYKGLKSGLNWYFDLSKQVRDLNEGIEALQTGQGQVLANQGSHAEALDGIQTSQNRVIGILEEHTRAMENQTAKLQSIGQTQVAQSEQLRQIHGAQVEERQQVAQIIKEQRETKQLLAVAIRVLLARRSKH